MSYLEQLQLKKEPFSNSPDPLSYYQSDVHERCLERLSHGINHKRGLHVVLGDVGTGKSTLCRCLLKRLNEQLGTKTLLILDPGFTTPLNFLRHLCLLILGSQEGNPLNKYDIHTLMDRIKGAVFTLTQQKNCTLVLLIDEGQKCPPECLEILRELLNFETNTEKLLQIVIFAQQELAPVIASMPNFRDRINDYITLRPLHYKETVAFVRHRLTLAGGKKAQDLFTTDGLLALHFASKGFPRRIVRLSHNCLVSLVNLQKPKVTWSLVRSVAHGEALADKQSEAQGKPLKLSTILVSTIFIALTAMTSVYLFRDVLPYLSQHTMPQATPVAPTIIITRPEQVAPAPTAQAVITSGSGYVYIPPRNLRSVPEHIPVPEPPAVDFPILGKITIVAQDKLTTLAGLIYGEKTDSIAKIIEINTHLEDPKALTPGTQLLLPLLQFEVPPAFQQGYLLSFGEFRSLETAYHTLRSTPNAIQETRLVALEEPGHPLRFLLLGSKAYATVEEANSALFKLSEQRLKGTIIPGLQPTTKIYHQL